jgi:hypothetical protein
VDKPYNACKNQLEISLYEADEWMSKAVVCTVSIVMSHATAQMSIYFADENATEQVHVSNPVVTNFLYIKISIDLLMKKHSQCYVRSAIVLSGIYYIIEKSL